MAHAYTTKRGKNKISKLGVRKDHQQNLEKSLKQNTPLANLMYDGPKESVFNIGHITGGPSTTASRITDIKNRIHKTLMDKCSNPDCKLAASAEISLSECSSCHQARYCCRDCQLAHWEEHKAMCKEIKKALKAKEKETAERVAAALKELDLNDESQNSETNADLLDGKLNEVVERDHSIEDVFKYVAINNDLDSNN
eukprot:gene10563-14189_t